MILGQMDGTSQGLAMLMLTLASLTCQRAPKEYQVSLTIDLKMIRFLGWRRPSLLAIQDPGPRELGLTYKTLSHKVPQQTRTLRSCFLLALCLSERFRVVALEHESETPVTNRPID
jgi:hypothetical protein